MIKDSEKKHFDSIAEKYDSVYGYDKKFNHYKINKKLGLVTNEIVKYFPNKKLKILEIGCGTGEYTALLANLFPEAEIIGMDISSGMLDIARQKCRNIRNIKLVKANVYKTDFKANEFDVILGFYVIHHLKLETLAKEISRIVKPGGFCLFYEPNILNPLVYLIKSNKFLKRLVGDSPEEWGVNPITFVKHFPDLEILKRLTTEFIYPLPFINEETLERMDGVSNLFSNIPVVNMFGGSVFMVLKKKDKIMLGQESVYDSLYNGKEYDEMNLPDYKIVRSKNVKGNKILIFGVGTGRDVKYLVKNNEVWGLDISKTAVETATKIGIKAFKSDLESVKIKLPADYFDIVVMKDILEHVNSPESVVSSAKKLLKRDGYIVISVPNHFYSLFRLKILFGGNLIWKTFGHDHSRLFNEWNYMHKVFFTWNGFQKFIDYENLKIVREFWDFGTLAHYDQPEMVFKYLDQTLAGNTKKYALPVLKNIWTVFNVVFPRKIRGAIVKTAPGFWSAGFYVWCKK